MIPRKNITIHMPARYAQYWGLRDPSVPVRWPWWARRMQLFTGIVGREWYGRLGPRLAWSISCSIWPRPKR